MNAVPQRTPGKAVVQGWHVGGDTLVGNPDWCPEPGFVNLGMR